MPKSHYLIRKLTKYSLAGLAPAERTMMLAPLVGVVAGIGAMLFHLMCVLLMHYLLGGVVKYDQGGPGNEAEFGQLFENQPLHNADGIVQQIAAISPWWLLVIITLGGLASGWIVYRFAPETQGDGTDAAIDSYHNKRGFARARAPLVKMVSSALTLCTGGSGGREGPISQIGSGFGSMLATGLKLSHNERRILMAAGMGAGVGAIFHAPLAGSIFAIEVLYSDPDFESEALIPAFIATTVSFSVFSLLMYCFTGQYAFDPLFVTPDNLTFRTPLLLIPLTVMALIMSLLSYLFVKCFYGSIDVFKKLPIPPTFRPAIGAFITGIVALGAYFFLQKTHGQQAANDSLSVLSFGYGYLQTILNPGNLPLLIPVLLAVGLGKILTTSLTLGSGGSGGVFGPSMVIGGAIGAVVGLVFHNWLIPDLVGEKEVVIFAILGMASFFAAAANTPVSALIIVSELTGSYELLLPSMWVCALSYMLSRKWTLYKEQVTSRLESPAHRGDFIIDVLEGMSISQVFSKSHQQYMPVNPGMPLKEMSHLLTDSKQSCFPVIDQNNQYQGLFGLNDIRQFLYDSDLAELAVAQDIAVAAEPLTLQMDLSGAIARFAQGQFEELPVVDEDKPSEILGLLRRQDVIAAYSSQLLAMRQD